MITTYELNQLRVQIEMKTLKHVKIVYTAQARKQRIRLLAAPDTSFVFLLS